MSNKIKVGVWGLGRAGNCMHAKEIGQYPDMFDLVAACDIDPERCKLYEEKVPGVRTYTDGDAFLQDQEVELVSVAVRSPDHVKYCIRALEAGKFVFAEKPIAISDEGCDRLLEAAKRFPGKLYCRQNRRFESCFNHIREIMASGILGEVYEIKLARHSFSFRNDWQTIIDCGGGQLNNWGPHLIDHGLRLLDSPLKDLWSDLKRVAALGDAEDHLKIIMRGENGRVIDIEISGGVALGSPVYAVYGTRGSLISPDEQDLQLRYLHPEYKEPTDKSSPGTPPLNGGMGGEYKPRWVRKTIMVEPENQATVTDIYKHLYKTIREGVEFPIKLEEAIEVVRVTNEVKRQNPRFAPCPDNK